MARILFAKIMALCYSDGVHPINHFKEKKNILIVPCSSKVFIGSIPCAVKKIGRLGISSISHFKNKTKKQKNFQRVYIYLLLFYTKLTWPLTCSLCFSTDKIHFYVLSYLLVLG